MEKIWKKASQSEYQKCFDILNTESLIERETYRKFAIELFEIAKKQLNCQDVELRFINDEKTNLGFSSNVNKTVTLNLQKMEKQTLYLTVSTIYHELTHIHQDKTDEKKKIGTSKPAKFPFVRCYGDERFLPRPILGGISPYLFYYSCQHEKQARDVGNECAMELFKTLKDISQTQETKNGTARFIDRCINQVQARWLKDNRDNDFATSQVNEFLKVYPNFVHESFDRIKQEFTNDAGKFPITSPERLQCEKRFNLRLGSLVLMGCDDQMKKQIFEFVSSNFVSQGEIFNTLISVTDSPYSTTTKEEFDVLLKFAEANNCPKETLFNLLVSWDKKYLNELANGKNPDNDKSFNGNNFGL